MREPSKERGVILEDPWLNKPLRSCRDCAIRTKERRCFSCGKFIPKHPQLTTSTSYQSQ